MLIARTLSFLRLDFPTLQAFSRGPNPKNTTVVFIYFESNHLVIQHKQARLAVKGGTKDD